MKRILDCIKNHYRLISVALILISVIPFVVISIYSRPCSDDYSFSIEMIRMVEKGNVNVFTVLKAAFETDVRFYKTWNGLYTSGFVQAMQPGSYLGEQNYYAGTLVLLLIAAGASYDFVKTMFRVFHIDFDPVLPSMLFFAFFIHGMISTIQGLYWYCGAFDYIPFFFLTIVNTALILKYYSSEKENWFLAALSMLISFINSGGNHITAFVNILILCVLSAVCLWKKKRYGVIASFLVAVGGFMLVVFAPGTRVRMDQFDKRNPIDTVIITAQKFIRLLLSKEYLLNLRFVVYMILLVFLASVIKDNKRIRNLDLHPIVLFLLLSMFQCGMLAVPYHAMGTFGAGRIKNIIWLAFMVSTALFVLYALVWLCRRSERFDSRMDLIKQLDKRIPVIILCLALIAFSRNMYSVIGELSDGTAKAFAQQYEERYELMKQYRGKGETVVLDHMIESRNLYFDDLSDDLGDWRNVAWSQYYDVPTIVKKSGN